jgi:hypothetical protein
LGGEGYGNVRPLGLGNGAFDSYVIYFSVIVPALSLGVKISIGTSGNYKDCVISWEGFILLRGFLGLWQRLDGGLASFLIWGDYFALGR